MGCGPSTAAAGMVSPQQSGSERATAERAAPAAAAAGREQGGDGGLAPQAVSCEAFEALRVAGSGEAGVGAAQMSLAARKDPSATAADPGVRAKVALVVGVAAYEGQPLRNPVNDARDVALALRACDFGVELALDVTRDEFEEAQARFEEHLAPGTLALFYFAGHGLEHAGENYLLMRDAPRGMDERQVRRKAVPVREVVQGMGDRQCAFQLIILDACRTAPVSRTGRNAGIKGLARMEVPGMEDGGVVIAYATAPGEEALDRDEGEDEDAGEGRNSLYTRHLLQHLRRPMPVRDMLEEVQFDVEAASGRMQKPWLHSRLMSRELKGLQLVDCLYMDGGSLRRMSSRTERLTKELGRERAEREALEARMEQAEAEAERAAAEAEAEARAARQKSEAPLNAPGHWEFFVSYTQHDPVAQVVARALFHKLREAGRTCWLDVEMGSKSEAAMREGVLNAKCFVAVVSDVYLTREFCLKELAWAKDNGKTIQPVVAADDKARIGELIGIGPPEAQFLRGIDFVDLHLSDSEYMDVGVKKICRNV